VRPACGAKAALVEAALDVHSGEFILTDLKHSCPGVSRDTVRRVLRDLQKGGKVVCLGHDPAAAWRKKAIRS
jgi:hypothetical protein